jgi:LacI family transcriptional regulator
MAAPRVLVVLKTDLAWSRGILRGFITTAHERGWALLHYDSPSYLHWLADAMAPVAAVVATDFDAAEFSKLGHTTFVCINVDRTAEKIASVCLDEEAIARLAYEHLHATGLRNVSTFRYDESPFAITRERAFIATARARGARVARGWGSGNVAPAERYENPVAMVAWLRALPKPCGIFTCTDSWGKAVARYAQLAGLRIPEDVALIGVDNDVLECELISPPLSSVLVPWVEVGRLAAQLVRTALSGRSIAGERIVVAPLAVIARRSSELLAVDDALVARAVDWIRGNVARRLTVPMVARAAASGRHRLERAFRRVLGRTVQEEIRRARVDGSKRLLETSRTGLAEIAKQSGFKTASLLTVAFQREIGMTPGHYRRRVAQELAGTDRS